MGFFDWLGRVVMLVLAGMITLSIIGAIAAIPSGGLPERIGMTQREAPAPLPSDPPQGSRPPTPTAGSQDRAAGTTTSQAGALPAEPEAADPAQWLEAITYALLALVGLAALAALILWRTLAQRRRIADALEAISLAARPEA